MSQNPFPQPPIYSALYTDEARDDPSHPDHKFYTPPPPLKEAFLKFGRRFTGKHTEYVLGEIPKLYEGPSDGKAGFDERINYSKELRQLNKMFIEQYVNMLQVISSPMPPMEREHAMAPLHYSLYGLSHVMDNITHLLNSLRQHQARQAVISLLQSQITEVNNKAQQLEDYSRASRALLESYGFDNIVPYSEPPRPAGGYMPRSEAHRDEIAVDQSALTGSEATNSLRSNSTGTTQEWKTDDLEFESYGNGSSSNAMEGDEWDE